MAISLTEELLTLQAARAHFPGRPHLSSIWRWATYGSRGVVLETLSVSARRYTSRQAIERFITATTAARQGAVSQALAKRPADQRTGDTLRRAGISRRQRD